MQSPFINLSGSPFGASRSRIASSAGPPHEYWRVRGITAGSFVGGGFSELQFRSTIGGANVATGGTVLKGSEFNGSLIAANLFDASDATAWAGTTLALSWVGYQFLTPTSIGEILLQARTGTDSSQAWVDFDAEYSDDGIAWFNYASITGQTSWTAAEIRTFAV